MPTASSSLLPRLDRRTAIKWMLTVAASTVALRSDAPAADAAAPRLGTGYGPDPDLVKIYQPGDVWPLTLTEAQRVTVAALCDTIIPADPVSPSASSVGVHDFIDEWISSPYPEQAADRTLLLEGLTWIDAEAERRFQRPFARLAPEQKDALCTDIAYLSKARPEFQSAARFFARFRDLTAGGFYTTPVGMKDIGYTGNMPLPAFPGPSLEVRKKLGLA